MKHVLFSLFSIGVIGLCVSCRQTARITENGKQVLDAKDSLVFIQVSSSRYDVLQPWKRSASQTEICYGTAVGPSEVVTIAEPFTYASVIQVKTSRSPEFIPASIKAIDYDLDLCLLKLDEKSSISLSPVTFGESFQRGLELKGQWLSSEAAVKNSRGFLDRAVVRNCPTSYQRILTFVLSSTSRQTSRGEVFTDSSGTAYGIAFSSSETEVAVIPGQMVNMFLKEAQKDTEYIGYGTPGFETYDLTDPSVRRYLKMPEEMKEGCYVSFVYSKGTGSDILKDGDVLLAIDGKTIDAFGKYKHALYEDISYEHLITLHRVGEPLSFTVFRGGQKIELQTKSTRFDSSEMLVPYQEYGKQPEYFITGGYVFQKLTLDYLRLWGENWQGKVPPHLLHYYRNLSMNPPAGRKEIVVLSYVLPAEINLGYQNLGRIVVKTCNGVEIQEMSDLARALTVASDSPFHVIEFELDYPTLVIPKANLEQIDQMIFQLYGIQKTSNILP
ncbi:MAG TPA: hypothetical protein PLV55_11995 [Anaerohalosphaeraceae bacterium]|nr:hypothetical protein [Anaerohalosphaeraceae bacterium]